VSGFGQILDDLHDLEAAHGELPDSRTDTSGS
jgi:hypothetical protein